MYSGKEACYQVENKDEEFYTQLVSGGLDEKGNDVFHVDMNKLCEGCGIQKECATQSLMVAGILSEDGKLIL